jgi:hypothetical protein
MLTTLLYGILIVLLFTTLYVAARTILFARRQRAVERVEGAPVDAGRVAEHLAAAVRCQTVALDDAGAPDPEAFRQLHQMLEQTYPLVHQQLKREVIGGQSLLYTWQGSRADLEPVMNKLSSLAILVLLVVGVGLNLANIVALIGSLGILALLIFIAGCLGIGLLLGGREPAIRSVMGLGTAQRNVSAAILVSVQNFSDTNTVSFVLVAAILMLLILLPAARRMGARA